MQWRLTLDEPYSFCLEAGTTRSVHCGDFRPGPDSFSSTWRDPVTGITMLRPSFFSRDYSTDFQQLDAFRSLQDAWRKVQRSIDLIPMFTTVSKPGGFLLQELLVNIALVAIAGLASAQDKLVWALESNFYLERDEAFVIHYHGNHDEIWRKNNWMKVQFDNIAIHLSYQGTARIYKYADRSNMQVQPAQVMQFDFAEPGELLNRYTRFMFIPVPALGLLFYTSHQAPRTAVMNASADLHGPRGFLIPWSPAYDTQGNAWNFERTQVRIALNPYRPHIIGFQNVRFPASGTYTDAVFDPGYKPTTAPSLTAPILIPSGKGNVAATLRKEDNSGVWVAGADRRGRVQLALSTTDSRWTPFIFGYGVGWSPVTASRNSTRLVLSNVSAGQASDTLEHLEFSQDEYSHFEGKATMRLQSAAARAIAERGDSTFKLENSPDGATWTFVEGGLAKEWKLEPIIDYTGYYYRAKCVMRNMIERLYETNILLPTAFDGMKVGDALNTFLAAAGLPQINPLPPESQAITLPRTADGARWRLGVREGDRGEEVIRTLLYFMRKQQEEWRLRFDLSTPAGATYLEKKPRDLTTIWQLVTTLAAQDAAGKKWRYSSLDLDIEPPEGNIVMAEGASTNDAHAERILSAPIVNNASLTDPTNPDYQGRAKWLIGKFYPLSDQQEIDKAARRLFDAVAHRRVRGSNVILPQLQMAIAPMTRINLLDNQGAVVADAWVKRRTVTIDMNDKETMALEFDTGWEGKL